MPFERSRVSDLQNPDDERPLAPHFRATRCQFTVCSQLFIAWLFHVFSNPGPAKGHWGYAGGGAKALGWGRDGRSTAGVAGWLPAEQVTGLIPLVFPKHYVFKIRIYTMLCFSNMFKRIQLSNSNLRFAEWSWACTKTATASDGGGSESPSVPLHGPFHGWWFGDDGEDSVQRGGPFHDKLVGHKRGCWPHPPSEIQLWRATANSGSAHHCWPCSQEPLLCFK